MITPILHKFVERQSEFVFFVRNFGCAPFYFAAKQTAKGAVEMNESRKRRLEQAYVLLAWKIFIYLKANPSVLEINGNREIYDSVRELCIQYFTRDEARVTREESTKLIDSVSDAKAASSGAECFVEQQTMELFHPNRAHDHEWAVQILAELASFNAERYV